MVRISPKKPPDSYSTSKIILEGLDLSLPTKLWRKGAQSDCRLTLLSKLLKLNVGLRDVEGFGDTLRLKLRSESLKKNKNCERKVVKEAMKLKLVDEIETRKEIKGEMDKFRGVLKGEVVENSRKYRNIMKHLRHEAAFERRDILEIYDEKISHLEKEKKIEEERSLTKVPPELSNFKEADIFSKERFDMITEEEISICMLGNIVLTDEEELILKYHPKYAVLERLKEDDNCLLVFKKFMIQY